MLVILVVSTSILFLLSHFIFAPNPSRISQVSLTSTIFGKLFITHVPSINNVAGKIAIAEFLAPLIATSPFQRSTTTNN